MKVVNDESSIRRDPVVDWRCQRGQRGARLPMRLPMQLPMRLCGGGGGRARQADHGADLQPVAGTCVHGDVRWACIGLQAPVST